MPEVMPDSIPTGKEELEMLKSMPFDDLMNKIVSDMVHFVISLAIAIVVFYVGRFIIRKLYRMTHSLLVRRGVDISLTTFILSVVKIVLYFILIVTVIGILGIETSSFLALFASAGVAIGMALSGTLQNFAGGVLILLLKPYRIGDYIETQGYAGTVTAIEIFNTYINTPDNKTIIIPNGGLSTGSINNYSKQEMRRVDWTIAISYGDDVDKARSAILEMLNADKRILHACHDGELGITHNASRIEDPVVVVSELADSSVNLSARAWVKTPDYWGVFFNFNETFYNQLPSKAGVSFPFPQMDVHVNQA